MNFFSTNSEDINNEKIKIYLLSNRIYPGQQTYDIIKDFFQSISGKHRSMFQFLDMTFLPFRKQMFDYYHKLTLREIDAHTVFAYRNLLTNFYCWLIQNNLRIKDMTNANLALDYIQTKNYISNHSLRDCWNFQNALKYFNAVYFETRFNVSAFNTIEEMEFADYFSPKYLNFMMRFTCNNFIKLFISMIQKLMIPFDTIIHLKYSDINFFNQTIRYPGHYSHIPLQGIFDKELKALLMQNFKPSQKNNYIFSHKSVYEANISRAFIADFSFELKNARITVSDPASLLRNLHNNLLWIR